MERNEIPELSTLLRKVEKKFGRPLVSTNDFRLLSALLEYECKEVVSVSTLKRLWGYVSQQTTPREATLDVLSRFVGSRNFKDFRKSMLGEYTESSAYFDTTYISASDVPDGGILSLGWAPDRLVRLRKTGGHNWQVVTSCNSKLKEGDVFEASSFFKGLPLFVPAVYRDGQKLPSYIAGKKDGLNKVSLERVLE